jgi:hypothetical protein
MILSSTEERALKLLGSGIEAEATARALGVTPSLISQMLSREEFAAQVQELRYKNLVQHNIRDSKYDELEDALLDKLSDASSLLMKPTEITRVLQAVNGAKRRGISAPEAINAQQKTVQLTMPSQIIQRFTMNVNNMVVQAGEQNLVTMQSGTLLKKLKEAGEQNVLTPPGTTQTSSQSIAAKTTEKI